MADKHVEQKRNVEGKKSRVKIDRTDNTLKDKAAVKFWNKHFKDKDIVTNEEFGDALKIYLQQKKTPLFKEEAKLDNFIKAMGTKFFLLVEPEKYPENTPPKNFVDKLCVQAAIHVFGPWIQMFELIKRDFFDEIVDTRKLPGPLTMWHGRILEKEAERLLQKKTMKNKDDEGWKSSKKARYLLRYGVGSIIISSIRRAKRARKIEFYHEPIRRKKPGIKHMVNCGTKIGKTKVIPPRWTYTERFACPGCFRDNSSHYTLLVNFLEMMRGHYCDDLEYRARRRTKVRTPVYALDMIPDDKKQNDESSDVPSPVIPVIRPYSGEEDTTQDEEVNKTLEESKES